MFFDLIGLIFIVFIVLKLAGRSGSTEAYNSVSSDADYEADVAPVYDFNHDPHDSSNISNL